MKAWTLLIWAMVWPISIVHAERLAPAGRSLLGSVHEYLAQPSNSLAGTYQAPQSQLRDVKLRSVQLREPIVAAVEAVQVTGEPANRFNFVIVGDGFSAADLPLYRQLVQRHVEAIFQITPFKEYRRFFNIYRVDVVSSSSGVALDPERPERTAQPSLGSSFACLGNPRLLCVEGDLAKRAASYAPAADHILVIANTATYGGAGYFDSAMAVYSGLHESAIEIAAHEMGHSIARLADEYDVGPRYDGPEVPFANASILKSGEMMAAQTKWFRWLGTHSAFHGGIVGTFEGADMAESGKFRPTTTSKMRQLGQPFNLPSIEAFVVRFYERVKPLDAIYPAASRVRPGRALRLQTVSPLSNMQLIEWSINGKVAKRGSLRFKIPVQRKAGGASVVTVRIQDSSGFVRDPAALNGPLSQSYTWSLSRGG